MRFKEFMKHTDRRLNDITLKEYIETRIDNLEESIKKSETILEVRLSHMNEFREQMECEGCHD